MKNSRQVRRQLERMVGGAFPTYKPVVNRSKTYKPNGEREVARRLAKVS